MKRAGKQTDPASVLLLDPDEERGLQTAASLAACGFPAAAAATISAFDAAATRKIAVLVVERSAVSSSGRRNQGPVLLDPAGIGKLRVACGASLVVSWNAAAAGDLTGEPPPWADGEVTGVAALIGRVALHAASAADETIGELAQTRRRIEEARRAAHDLSQPLTTIVARSRLLLETMNEAEPGYRPLAIISQEAERLARSIERIKAVLPPRRGV